MVANILPTYTPSTQGVGSKGQTIYFSESSHVAYQIKADDAGSNMVANILPTDMTQGVGSKCQTISFTESIHVAYQIKGNFACRQSSNRYETYQTRFQFEGLGPSLLGGLRGWGRGQN